MHAPAGTQTCRTALGTCRGVAGATEGAQSHHQCLAAGRRQTLAASLGVFWTHVSFETSLAVWLCLERSILLPPHPHDAAGTPGEQ